MDAPSIQSAATTIPGTMRRWALRCCLHCLSSSQNMTASRMKVGAMVSSTLRIRIPWTSAAGIRLTGMAGTVRAVGSPRTARGTVDASKKGSGYYPPGNPYVNATHGGGTGCHFASYAPYGIDQTNANGKMGSILQEHLAHRRTSRRDLARLMTVSGRT